MLFRYRIYIIFIGNVKVVKYLLSINVDILKQDNKGRTALHNAVWGV